MKVEKVGDRLQLLPSFREFELVRTVPGTTWSRKEQCWWMSCTWTSCLVLRGIFGDHLEVGPALAEWSWTERARVEELERLRDAEDAPGQAGLYPDQRVDAAFLRLAGGVIAAHETGVGKTPVVVEAIRQNAEEGAGLPALIVAPKSSRWQIVDEFARWAPDLHVLEVKGTAPQRRKLLAQEADVYLTNWDVVPKHSRLATFGQTKLKRCLKCGADETEAVKDTSCEVHPRELNGRGWQTIVLDEGHRLCNPRNLWTRAAWWLAGEEDVRWRWALTATPQEEGPDDLWSILHFAAPLEFPTKSKWVERYCQQVWTPYGMDVVGLRPDTREEFHRVLAPHWLRRTLAEARPGIPEPAWVPRLVELPATIRKQYENMDEEWIAEVDGGALVAHDGLSAATRKSQLAAAAVEVNDQGVVRLKNPSPKVNDLLAFLEQFGQKALVVFAKSRQLIQLAEAKLEEKGYRWASVHGGVPDEERQQAVRRFQAGEVQVLLLTYGAGSEGLNLTRTDTLYLLQPTWSKREFVQALGRFRRPGQEATALAVVAALAEGTIEEEQVDRVEEKLERFEEVARDRERLAAVLARKEHL